MAGAPRGMESERVEAELLAIPSVQGVHDLHVWTLVGDKRNMWAHLTLAPGADSTKTLYAAQAVARAHSCHHSAFQLEDAASYDRSVEGDSCFEPGRVPLVTAGGHLDLRGSARLGTRNGGTFSFRRRALFIPTAGTLLRRWWASWPLAAPGARRRAAASRRGGRD
jgi:hypothetical protein